MRLFLGVLGVGADDGLDKRMPDDVVACEMKEFDAIDGVKDAGGFDEAGEFGAGEVDLSDVTGNNHTTGIA
jgi:hypothetical protein